MRYPIFAKYKWDTTLFEQKLHVGATSRNWKVTNKVVAMMEAMMNDEQQRDANNKKKAAPRKRKPATGKHDHDSGTPSSPRSSISSKHFKADGTAADTVDGERNF